MRGAPVTTPPAQLSPPPRSTVTGRDEHGHVVLCPDDIAAIADAVYERIRSDFALPPTLAGKMREKPPEAL